MQASNSDLAAHVLERPVQGLRSARWLVLACRLAIGTIFVLAAAIKLANPGAFAATLLAYGILPVETIRTFALTLPWIELGTGLFLLLGLFTRQAAALAIGLLALFSIVIAQALIRGLSLAHCGCFGDITSSVPALGLVLGGEGAGWQDVVRDLIYAAIAFVVVVGPESPFQAGTVLGKRTVPSDESTG